MSDPCVMLRFKVGKAEHEVCLAVPGNDRVLVEAKAGRTRKPADYTDEEIARAVLHHAMHHGHDAAEEGD